MKQTSLLAVLILIGLVFTASFLLAVVCDASTPNPEVHTAAVTKAPATPTLEPTNTPSKPPYDDPYGLRLLGGGDHIGEFGGFLNKGSEKHVYITRGNFDPALHQGARDRFDEIYRRDPSQKIVIHEAKYTWGQLQEWKQTIGNVMHKHDRTGIYSWGISHRFRQVHLNASPMRGNRERIEAMLATTDVPRDTVRVNIGCGDYIPPDHTTENIPPGFSDIFAYSVEAPAQVQHGKTVDLKLIIQNLTPTPAHIYGGTNSVDFAITNKAGENLWYWQCGKVNQMDLRSQNVSPSEPLEFTGHWEQIDTKGYPVPPGVYLIKGVLDMEYPEKLVTAPISIEILPP